MHYGPYASGSPNPLGYDDATENDFLPDYHRLDAGLKAHFYGKNVTVKSRISFLQPLR